MKNQIVRFLRRVTFQPLWEKLYHVSKIGMNYWGGASIYHSGEIYAMRYVWEKLKKKSGKVCVFDVGANYGQFATEVSKVFTGEKVIYSFEPSRYTFEKLKETISTHGLEKEVVPVNKGVGAKSEILKLYTSGKGSAIASVYNLSMPSVEFNEQLTEEIDIGTIDEFCESNGIPEIDFLKVDIEGHEFQALLGGEKMIKNGKVRFIQFEFGECHIDSRTFFRDFFNYLSPQYRIYRIVSNGIWPIDHYSTDHEVFNTINYLAELKQK